MAAMHLSQGRCHREVFRLHRNGQVIPISSACITSADRGKCRALFADGKEQEAIDHAAVTLEKFIKAKNDLAWIGIGSIKTEKHRIDVHYNMGRKERAEKKDGIVRPYSFRVWSTGDTPELVHILDFEIGYSDGEALTAAIGEMTDQGHGRALPNR